MAFKQAIIVNNDLKMSKGKIAAQVAHGMQFYMQAVYENKEDEVFKRYKQWSTEGDAPMKKVVLRANGKEMVELTVTLKDKVLAYPVFDAGLTEVPPNSFTCLVVEPILDKEYNKYFSDFKLL